MLLGLSVSPEAVSKLQLNGPSALCFLPRTFPGASPQADIVRAFGAQIIWFELFKAPKARSA